MALNLLSLIFPPKCIFCGTLLKYGAKVEICKVCYSRIPFVSHCLAKGNIAGTGADYYDHVTCLCEYSGNIKHSLLKYKFFDKPGYYRAFAQLLAQRLKDLNEFQKYDMVMGVPLYRARERTRGYNQSYLISKVLSRELGLQEASHMLVRVRDTGSQSLLHRQQRITNIKNAFKVVSPDKVKGKNILVVDDILTTGSTINECCRTLKAAGANKTFAAVVATGRKF